MLKHTRHTHNHQVVLSLTGLTGGLDSHPLFVNLDLALPAGITAVIGDEGQGKTSLLRLLAADLKPTHGQMTLHSSPPCQWPEQAKAYQTQVFWCDLSLPGQDNDTVHACWDAWRGLAREHEAGLNDVREPAVEELAGVACLQDGGHVLFDDQAIEQIIGLAELLLHLEHVGADATPAVERVHARVA